MEVQERNSTRIYPLSNGPSVPEWMGERARRNLSKTDEAVRRRIELLQDFAMPSTSSKLVTSRDGRYLLAAGTYSPRIRCYELSELGMKFERNVDADIIDMTMLGMDYGKVALLQSDRSVVFHAPYGTHTSMRIPTFGRAMTYEASTCELLIACSANSRRKSKSSISNDGVGGGEVYRINLEEGRFAPSLTYSSSSSSDNSLVGGNCIDVSPTHAMTALGCDDGMIRFWDNRFSSSSSGLDPMIHLDVQSSVQGYGYHDSNSHQNPNEITSIAFDPSGIYMAAGTAGGCVVLYDVRTSKPLHVKEHQYGLPIHTIKFHAHGNDGSSLILSSDAKLVKLWRSKPSAVIIGGTSTEEEEDNDIIATTTSKDNNNNNNNNNNNTSMGSIVANIEGTADFNHFIVCGDETDPKGQNSGLILCAGEQPKMQAFYIPILGRAPRWCSFLDGITEELEERDLLLPENSNGGGSLLSTADSSSSSSTMNIYDDYKFLTRSDIESLGMQHLIGTPLLRGYMHGFFVHVGLYNRIRAVAQPFAYEDYRKRKIREKMQEKMASRIAPKQQQHQLLSKAKVNVDLAKRLGEKALSMIQRVEDDDENDNEENDGMNHHKNKKNKNNNNKAGQAANALLQDKRFGALFKNPDFEIDETDDNFKLRNPSGISQAGKKIRKQRDDVDSDDDGNDDDDDDDGFQKVDEDDESDWDNQSDDDNEDENSNEEDSSDESNSDEDGFGAKVKGENFDYIKNIMMTKDHSTADTKKKQQQQKRKQKKKRVILYEAEHDDEETLVPRSTIAANNNKNNTENANVVGLGLGNVSSASAQVKRRRNELSQSLEERLQQMNEKEERLGMTKQISSIIRGEGRSREVTFMPKDSRKQQQQKKIEEEEEDRREEGNGKSKRKRRGIKELRLKTPFKNTTS